MQRTQQSYQDNEGLGRGVNKMGARLDRMYLLILFWFLNYRNMLTYSKEESFSLEKKPSKQI